MIVDETEGRINYRLIEIDTLRAVGFSYAKRERNHCEQPSAFPSSMRELVTPHVMHLMSSSFVNIFFCWKCFGTKESKCTSPKALTKERFNSHCIFVIIVQKLLRCFYGKKRYFFTTSMFADRYFGTLPWHEKSQQSASKVACPSPVPELSFLPAPYRG